MSSSQRMQLQGRSLYQTLWSMACALQDHWTFSASDKMAKWALLLTFQGVASGIPRILFLLDLLWHHAQLWWQLHVPINLFVTGIIIMCILMFDSQHNIKSLYSAVLDEPPLVSTANCDTHWLTSTHTHTHTVTVAHTHRHIASQCTCSQFNFGLFIGT